MTQYVSRFPQATPDDVCRWIDYRGSAPAGRFWVLDPIDGTKGFLRSDQYAVALALVVDGQVQLGLLGCPQPGRRYRPDLEGPGSLVIAAAGRGLPRSLSRAALSGCRSPSAASTPTPACFARSNLDTPTSGRSTCSPRPWAYRPNRCAWTARPSTPCWPPARELLLRLLSSAKPDYREKIWDQAGSIVVEEAGGKITDLHGKPLDFTAGRTRPAIEASWPQHPAPPGCPGCTESYRSLKIREA